MVKKKQEETKKKKNTKSKGDVIKATIHIEKFSIGELLEKNNIKLLEAGGFLEYYGLVEEFEKEFNNLEVLNKFSEAEFKDMYKRYIEREL